MNFADQTAEIPKKQMQLQLREVSVALYQLVVHQLLKNIEHMQKKKICHCLWSPLSLTITIILWLQ